MIKSGSGSIDISAQWKIIDELKTELDSRNIENIRGPNCFSATTLEWIRVFVPLCSTAVTALAYVLAAKLQQNKVKIRYIDSEKDVLVEAKTKEELVEIVKELNLIKAIKIE